jgi:MFS family permease
MRRVAGQTSSAPILGLLGANAISEVGNVLSAIAIQWFALQSTDSALLAGLVGIVTLVSYALAGALGGALVDRVGFRQMSVAADLASAVAVALIPLLHGTIGLSYWLWLLLVFLGALLDAPGATARQSLVPDVAGLAGTSLDRANAAYSNVLSGANLAGPLIAGVLIAAIGVSQVLWINAVSFLCSAALIQAAVPRTVPPVSEETLARGGYLSEVCEGFQFIRRDPLILGLVSMSGLANVVAGGLTGVTLLVYADQVFGSAAHLGVIYAGAGAGFLLGGVVYGIVAPRFSRRATLLVSLVLAGLPIWLLALTPGIVLTTGLVILRAVALAPIRPLVATTLQERAGGPAWSRHRQLPCGRHALRAAWDSGGRRHHRAVRLGGDHCWFGDPVRAGEPQRRCHSRIQRDVGNQESETHERARLPPRWPIASSLEHGAAIAGLSPTSRTSLSD